MYSARFRCLKLTNVHYWCTSFPASCSCMSWRNWSLNVQKKKNSALPSVSHPVISVNILPCKVLQLSNEDHALFLLYTAWGRQSRRGDGMGEKGNSHSILYFSISWTSAMDSRRSSVNFLRSWGLGALKLMRTLMSAPGIADVSLIPFG